MSSQLVSRCQPSSSPQLYSLTPGQTLPEIFVRVWGEDRRGQERVLSPHQEPHQPGVGGGGDRPGPSGGLMKVSSAKQLQPRDLPGSRQCQLESLRDILSHVTGCLVRRLQASHPASLLASSVLVTRVMTRDRPADRRTRWEVRPRGGPWWACWPWNTTPSSPASHCSQWWYR